MLPVSTSFNTDAFAMEIFPNPLYRGPVTLKFSGVTGHIEIKVINYNALTCEEEVYTGTFHLIRQSQKVVLSVFSYLGQGRYIISVKSKESEIQTIVLKK
jgi:hypothetical protein